MKSRDVKGKGFVDAVKEMKLYLESMAREVNSTIAQRDGAITELGAIENVAPVTESAAELAKAVEQLTLEVRDAKRDRERADKFSGVTFNADNVAELQACKEKKESDATAIQANIDLIQTEIDQLIRSQQQYKEDLAAAKAEVKQIAERIRQAEESQKQVEEIKSQIASAPSVEQIEAKEAELAGLKDRHVAVIRAEAEVEKIAQKRQRLESLQTQRDELAKQHASYKAKAEATSGLLKEALKIVPGWTVNEDLRLCVEHSRGVIPFSELSPGEGTAKVCLLACQFAECGADEIPIVGLPQHCFEGLDGKNRQALLDAAQEHGLCIVTAECDTNPETAVGLRVEVME